jgi:Flp pilus assembly CpaE family ATPase
MRVLVVGESIEARDRGRRAVLALGLECGAADAIALEGLGDRAAAYPPADAILLMAGRGPRDTEPIERLGLPWFVAGGNTDDYPSARHLDQSNLREELARMLQGQTSPLRGAFRWGRAVAVMAAHAGAGVTTIAAGIAQWLLRLEGGEVAVVEIGAAPDLSPMLGLDPPNGLAELIEESECLDAAMLQQAMATHPAGLKVLGSRADRDSAATLEPGWLRGLVHLLRGLFDWTVFDFGYGLNEATRAMLQLVEQVVVTVALDVPGIRRARHLLERLDNEELTRGKTLLIAANRYGQSGLLPWQEAVEALGRPVSAWLPDDVKRVNRARNDGMPIPAMFRRAALPTALRRLAKTLTERVPAKG